ncbi:hypothetical protein ACIQLK_11350 [Microbacterium sp. NPDC091382]|uniref:hypothetical protein n=1 Tax=Microbacterium sp. NPDC091382 TaxID=3364210 RepID=UPI00381A2597
MTVSTLVLASACGASSLPTGPLFAHVADSPHAYVYVVDEPEMEFTDGFETFAALDDADVVIESIRSVGDAEEVTVLGALISGPLGENGTWQSFDSYPPIEGLDGEVLEAEGARIPAGSGHYQILIGYRGVIEEMSIRSGVEVTYRVGEITYRDTLPARIIMCPADQEQACLDEMDRPVEELGDAP